MEKIDKLIEVINHLLEDADMKECNGTITLKVQNKRVVSYDAKLEKEYKKDLTK